MFGFHIRRVVGAPTMYMYPGVGQWSGVEADISHREPHFDLV